MASAAHITAGLVGAGLIGTVVHGSIMTSGGYDTTSSPQTIGLAFGLAVGAVALGICWGERRRVLAVLICLGLLAGEGYALILTAERTLAYRETKQAPLKVAAEQREKAAQRLADAELALAAASDTPRLIRALEAKKIADAAVVSKAAEKGCAANCRVLLEMQVIEAAKELEAARAEAAREHTKAETHVIDARNTLTALPAPGSATPLADRLGVAGWKVDLMAATLASLAANGLGAFLIAFAAHHRRPELVRVIRASSVEVKAAPTTQASEVWLQSRTANTEAARFARAMFRPSPSDTVVVADIRAAYHDWCQTEGVAPLPDQEIGKALNDLFSSVGLTVERDGSRPIVAGISWTNHAPAAVRAA